MTNNKISLVCKLVEADEMLYYGLSHDIYGVSCECGILYKEEIKRPEMKRPVDLRVQEYRTASRNAETR